MATITAITAQKKNKNRVNLFLDGEFFCSLDSVAALGARIKPGDEIDPDRLKEIVFKSECASALSRAMKYLGIKASSERQIRDYLSEKGYDEDVTEAAVLRLFELNYLDDTAVAAAYVKSCNGRYGNGLLRLKLKERGITSEIIAAVLPGREEETESALKMAQKYLSQNPPDKQKLYNHLFNKGFPSESIGTCTHEFIKD